MDELENVAPGLLVYKYHGDNRASSDRGNVKYIDVLTKEHEICQNLDDNARTVVVTTYHTWAIRHGPQRQAEYLRSECKMTTEEVMELKDVLDPDFPYGMTGVFERIIMDEAQVIRNKDTNAHRALQWLCARFHVCVTATPTFNSSNDFLGILRFLKLYDEKVQEISNTYLIKDNLNPFDIEDNHPAAFLRVTEPAFLRYIADKKVDNATRGLRIRAIWERCMLRRTYASRIPFRDGTEIANDMPASISYSIETNFVTHEKFIHDCLAEPLYPKIGKTLPDGKVVWNFGIVRRLILYATWLGFEHLQSLTLQDSLVEWMTSNSCLWDWLDYCHTVDPAHWDAPPSRTDEAAILAAFLHGAPKIRALLQIVADQVHKDQEKALIWVTFPTQQILICKLLRLMGIRTDLLIRDRVGYQARREIINSFQHDNGPEGIQVLIGTYALGSAGINLQNLCRNVHLFDPPGSDAIGIQAVGRVRRIGQLREVKVFEYYVQGTVNEFQRWKNLQKALPGVLAQLNNRIFQGKESSELDIKDLESWCMTEDGKLIRSDHELAVGRPKLSAEKMIENLMKRSKGDTVVIIS